VPLVNGIDIHLEVRGDESAPRTLFLNGSGATLASSGLLVDVFARRLQVACHDQRGLGRTESPPTPWSMADYAADALAVLDHLGWDTAGVVGISFGGMVAQELAVTAPERVERLALVCTSPGGDGGSSYPLHDLVGLPADERSRRYRTILDTRFTDEWLADHPGDAGLVSMMEQGHLQDKTPDVVHGEWQQLMARRGHDVWDRLPVITSPTLVSAGRFDGIAPLANSEAIAARIPRSELRVYDGGHAFFVQDRAAFPDLLDHLDPR
jgi:pimeloyl-ACP methyl ester carboxylesterase